MKLAVLRLSHRVFRDKRITTHLALTARAFGATEFYYTGNHDTHLEESVSRVCEEWGGEMIVSSVESHLNFIKNWKKQRGIVIHLTMFGIDLQDKLDELKQLPTESILVVVGGIKVPGFMYELADYNIAIGNQPHSEVAALAVCLDHLTESKARRQKFKDAKVEVVPSEKGKLMKGREEGE